jgi:hypothetical protein
MPNDDQSDMCLQLLVISNASLLVCVVAILQFYKKLKPLLAHHKPLLQIICIKAIVILDSVQAVS